jgi:hypothetical protein
MIEYLRVTWHHDDVDYPVLLLSEVRDRFEVRKIDKFRDGRVQFAGPDGATGDTMLSWVEVPSPEEIAQDPEFSVELIDADEFESEWTAVVGQLPNS